MKKKLLLFIFLAVLINICWQCSRDRIYYYKIPYVNKMLTIYIPAYSDSAYAYIGTHKMEARIDSFDLKLLKYSCTRVPLILNKHKNDTIYCTDESVTLINNSGKYKKIKWDDERFCVISTNKHPAQYYYMRSGYIEIIILDYAKWIACRIDSTCQILKLKRDSVVSIK